MYTKHAVDRAVIFFVFLHGINSIVVYAPKTKLGLAKYVNWRVNKSIVGTTHHSRTGASCVLQFLCLCELSVSILQATQSLESTNKEESGKTPAESGKQQQQLQLLQDQSSPGADKGAVRRSSSGGFIVSKPDPSILSVGPHLRHNYRGGGRGEYQRQLTLPSLPEMEDSPGALREDEEKEEGEGEEKEDGGATEAHSRQQHRLLTTL